jgi:small-conductance mechanosensitive channel
MRNRLAASVCRLLLLVLVACPCWPLQAATPVASQEQKNVDKGGSAQDGERSTIVDLFTWAGLQRQGFIDLETELDGLQDLGGIAGQLPALTESVDLLEREIEAFATSPDRNRYQPEIFNNRISRVRLQLLKLKGPVADMITRLSHLHGEWSGKKQTLADYHRQTDLPMAFIVEEKKDLAEVIDSAVALIEKRLNPALATGKEIAGLQVRISAAESRTDRIKTEIRRESAQQTSPSMLSPEFYSRLNAVLLRDSFERLRGFLSQQQENLRGHSVLLFFGVIGVILLWLAVRSSRANTSPASYWYPFARCPLAATTFIVSVSAAILVILIVEFNLPQQWQQLLHILNVVSVAFLLKNAITDNWFRRGLRRLAFFLATTLLLMVIGLPEMLVFIFVFYSSLVAVLMYGYGLIRRTPPSNPWLLWVRRVWGLPPLFILLSGVSGYDQFAVFLFSACLSTIVAFLTIWMLYRLLLGVLELLCARVPFPLVRESKAAIISSLRPLILILHLLLAASVIGVLWGNHKTVGKALAALADVGFAVGDVHISPGFIIVVAVVFYVALLVSRAVQTILLREVLPRYGADKGVQISISRLVHYAVLTCGFFVMLRVLGFKPEQITILGGAFGVGIAFGLQAIVNNFASGLILLFERPIKVGDTLQLGSEFGEVKKMGLRATVIRTFDNAEIVVPNSDLITGQVTNWTLASRKVRVRVPIGVAYGTEVAKVLEILRGIAAANPMVLGDPPPAAFFLAFGASSLDFELRVWIPDFLEKTQVLSDLNQDIEAELSANGIEIPFPQTDLHIRSVDPQAAARVQGGIWQGREGAEASAGPAAVP